MRNLTRFETTSFKTASKMILLQLGLLCMLSNANNNLKVKLSQNQRKMLSQGINLNEFDSSVDIADLYDVEDERISPSFNQYFENDDDMDSYFYSTQSSLNQQNHSSPKVKATQSIIFDAPFTQTDYYKYVQAVQSGLALKWTSQATCFQSSYLLLNDLFYTKQNITGYTVPVVKSNGDRQVEMVAFNISQVVSKNFASTLYNCYIMTSSAIQQTQVWFNSFVDFSDVYTAFLFNLLSESMKLKTIATNLQTSQNNGDWANFWKAIAQLVNICFDFESSNAESLEEGLNMNDWLNTMKFANKKLDLEDQESTKTLQKLIISSAAFLKQIFPSWSQPLNKENKYVKTIEYGKALGSKLNDNIMKYSRLSEQINNKYQKIFNQQQTVKNKFNIVQETVDYTFEFEDLFNILFGTIEGAASAIPSSVYNYQCGKNVTNSRQYFNAADQDFAKEKPDSGMQNINKMLQNFDDITINCWLGFKEVSNLNAQTLFSADGMVQNLLYNAGFMFTDILDVIWYDEEDTEPFWYYLAYRGGDFLVRFIYRDTTSII